MEKAWMDSTFREDVATTAREASRVSTAEGKINGNHQNMAQ
jgi:hypothetical protein